MVILVQNEKTKLFLAGATKWTAKRKQALTFSSTVKALRFCLNHRIRDGLLLCCYRNSALNFTIAPFADHEPVENVSFSALQTSIYYQAKSMELKLENRQLRNELDSLISEGKERRKKRKFSGSSAKGFTHLKAQAQPNLQSFTAPRTIGKPPAGPSLGA